MQIIPYNLDDDPVIEALRAEGAADPDVIGILVTGSRANGAVTAESDYDVIFIVSDETMARYEREQREPKRGETIDPSIDTSDIQWHECPRTLRSYNTFGVDLCRVIYDRTGEVTALSEELRLMPEEQAREKAATSYGAYLNSMFRSLKCWRRSDELGARLNATQSVEDLLDTLFALERLWRPFESRVYLHLNKLTGQGWQEDELRRNLLDLLTTTDPRQQQDFARRVIALMAERGYGHVYADWPSERFGVALDWNF
jgi:predicted nucleotidyltransferase